VLCAPSNDWLDGFEERHHRTAVWAAVRTGTTVVRATGHGISAVFDGTGRVLARASSANGPVVLVVDAPVEAGLQGNR
jgi:apolipoprotein N-acyltransferase